MYWEAEIGFCGQIVPDDALGAGGAVIEEPAHILDIHADTAVGGHAADGVEGGAGEIALHRPAVEDGVEVDAARDLYPVLGVTVVLGEVAEAPAPGVEGEGAGGRGRGFGARGAEGLHGDRVVFACLALLIDCDDVVGQIDLHIVLVGVGICVVDRIKGSGLCNVLSGCSGQNSRESQRAQQRANHAF